MQRTKPFISLGYYRPVDHKAWKVGRDLTRLTASLGYTPFPKIGGRVNIGAAWSRPALHAEARLTGSSMSEGAGWHQDGDNTRGADMNHTLILWADRDPTQFLADDVVYQACPYEVVAFHNLRGHHRRPPTVEGSRMSFRQRVKNKA